MISAIHSNFVSGRRVKIIAHAIAELFPERARALDVGCGDGQIDKEIMKLRHDVTISGIDVLMRSRGHIDVKWFDGETIPFPDKSFDVAMLIDVLHHTREPRMLLRECCRIARTIIIKDHLRTGLFAQSTLRFMDWVGNARFGVQLTYNYLSPQQWDIAFEELGLERKLVVMPGLYPFPFSLLFGRQLHFLAVVASKSAR